MQTKYQDGDESVVTEKHLTVSEVKFDMENTPYVPALIAVNIGRLISRLNNAGNKPQVKFLAHSMPKESLAPSSPASVRVSVASGSAIVTHRTLKSVYQDVITDHMLRLMRSLLVHPFPQNITKAENPDHAVPEIIVQYLSLVEGKNVDVSDAEILVLLRAAAQDTGYPAPDFVREYLAHVETRGTAGIQQIGMQWFFNALEEYRVKTESVYACSVQVALARQMLNDVTKLRHEFERERQQFFNMLPAKVREQHTAERILDTLTPEVIAQLQPAALQIVVVKSRAALIEKQTLEKGLRKHLQTLRPGWFADLCNSVGRVRDLWSGCLTQAEKNTFLIPVMQYFGEAWRLGVDQSKCNEQGLSQMFCQFVRGILPKVQKEHEGLDAQWEQVMRPAWFFVELMDAVDPAFAYAHAMYLRLAKVRADLVVKFGQPTDTDPAKDVSSGVIAVFDALLAKFDLSELAPEELHQRCLGWVEHVKTFIGTSLVGEQGYAQQESRSVKSDDPRRYFQATFEGLELALDVRGGITVRDANVDKAGRRELLGMFQSLVADLQQMHKTYEKTTESYTGATVTEAVRNRFKPCLPPAVLSFDINAVAVDSTGGLVRDVRHRAGSFASVLSDARSSRGSAAPVSVSGIPAALMSVPASGSGDQSAVVVTPTTVPAPE